MSDAASESPKLSAGGAQVDITPEMGTQIAGDICRRRPAESVRDPIYAKALVLERQGRRLCVLSLDLLAVTHKCADEIRRRAADEFGLDPNAVMVHVVQNHASPALGHFMVTDACKLIPPELDWLRGGDRAYEPFALERILDAVGQALGSLEPVEVAAGSGVDGRVAFNRRFVMRDGRAEMNPSQDRDNILYREGPMDPEVGVVCFRSESSQTLAMLLHHTCHPCHAFGYNVITAGWPGAWANETKKACGERCVPLVINGCCGNVIHRDTLDPTQVDDPDRMGRVLAETTRNVLGKIEYQHEAELDWTTKHIKIPLRELDPAQVEAARKLLQEHPEPVWLDAAHMRVDREWFYALSTLDLAGLCEREPEFDYEIQVFRVGDRAIVALVGEPFVQAQLRIKLESPARRTYIAHMSNGYVGYLPTLEALQRGGYETRTAFWSKLAPEALDMVTEETIEAIQGLFAETSP